MELFIIRAEDYKLDGGACFGVVPKSIWSKAYTTDENNLLPISIRCLLVKTTNKLILFDAGIGSKQSGKFYEHLHIFSEDNAMEKSLNKNGFSTDDITDIIFTHLHFDHVGGAVKIDNVTNESKLTFKNANYWCSEQQWNWAMNSNKREIASYLPENLLPIKESGKLNFINKNNVFTEGVELRLFNGHTDGQIIPFIDYKGRKIVFMADFIPSVGNIPLPYVASFDTRPLLSMKEKEEFLKQAVEENQILLFQHDYSHECCTLEKTEKGIKANKVFNFSEI